MADVESVIKEFCEARNGKFDISWSWDEDFLGYFCEIRRDNEELEIHYMDFGGYKDISLDVYYKRDLESLTEEEFRRIPPTDIVRLEEEDLKPHLRERLEKYASRFSCYVEGEYVHEPKVVADCAVYMFVDRDELDKLSDREFKDLLEETVDMLRDWTNIAEKEYSKVKSKAYLARM